MYHTWSDVGGRGAKRASKISDCFRTRCTGDLILVPENESAGDRCMRSMIRSKKLLRVSWMGRPGCERAIENKRQFSHRLRGFSIVRVQANERRRVLALFAFYRPPRMILFIFCPRSPHKFSTTTTTTTPSIASVHAHNTAAPSHRSYAACLPFRHLLAAPHSRLK